MPSGAIPYPFGDCRVCGDHATGVHYGVATCEGCKGFYKRSLAKAYKYRCFHGGKCTISPLERNRCKSCRYQRCVIVGMSVDGVKMGRIPKVDKERALEEHYGCGSREILSSGLVVPHASKRQNRDAKDAAKLAASEARSLGSSLQFTSGNGDSYAPDPQQVFVMENFRNVEAGKVGIGASNARHGRGGVGLRDENLGSPNDAFSYSLMGRGADRLNAAAEYAGGCDSRMSYDEPRSRNPSERSYSRSCQSTEDGVDASVYADSLTNMPIDRPISLRFAGELRNWRVEEQRELVDEKFMVPERDLSRFGARASVDGEAYQDWSHRNVRHGSDYNDDEGIRLSYGQGAYTGYHGQTSPTLPSAVRGRSMEAMTDGSSGSQKIGNGRYGEQPRKEESGYSRNGERLTFSPPIIKGLITQVTGKDSREMKPSFSKQFLSDENSRIHLPRTNIVEPSTSTSYTSSASVHSPGLHATDPPANSWRQNDANGSIGYTDNRSDMDGADSEMDYEAAEESGDGMGSRDQQSRISERRTWKGRIPGALDASDIKASDGCTAQLRRSHSDCDLLDNVKPAEKQQIKRRSLEVDDTEVINYEPLGVNEDMHVGHQDFMDWSNKEGQTIKTKKYELQHLMVEAGQRGKLRDAIDNICEDMANGDVPIMNLDSHAITVDGEQSLDFRSKPFQAQKRAFNDGIRVYEVNEEGCCMPVYTTRRRTKVDQEPDLSIAAEIEAETDESKTAFNGPRLKCESSVCSGDSNSPDLSPGGEIISADVDDDISLSGPMNSCCIDSEPAMKRRLVNAPVNPIHVDGSKNQAKFFMHQGYVGRSGRPASPSANNDFKVSDNGGCMVVMRRNSDQNDLTDGEEGESMRKSRLMNRVLRCLQTFADKLMNLIEIEIGIAADEALGRRPLHKLNDPKATITQEDVYVFWKDFMQTLPRGNSVVMGLCANIPGFKQLNVGDQLILIEQAYYMLWMILYSRLFWDGECHIRINCEAVYSRGWYSRFFPESLVDSMFSFVEELNRCKLTPIELIILCSLQLTNVDRAKLENPAKVRRLHDYYLDLLAHEIEKNHVNNHSRVLIKIFQLLPLLAPMNQQQLEVVDTFSVDRPPSN